MGWESAWGVPGAGIGSTSTAGLTTAFITSSTTPYPTIASTMPARAVIIALLPRSIWCGAPDAVRYKNAP